MAQPTPKRQKIQYDVNQGHNVRGDKRSFLTNRREVLNQSVRNILTTRVGSVLRNREFGSNLRSLLAEPLSEEVALDLFENMAATIGRFEPRIEIMVSRSAIGVDYRNRRYTVDLHYIDIANNDIYSFGFSIPVGEA